MEGDYKIEDKRKSKIPKLFLLMLMAIQRNEYKRCFLCFRFFTNGASLLFIVDIYFCLTKPLNPMSNDVKNKKKIQ